MSSTPSWYGARIVMERLHPDSQIEDRLFEERIILIRANTEDEARRKAEQFGQAGREEYENPYGERVIWAFKEVLDVKPLFADSIGDGTEVYYSFIMGEEELECLRRLSRPPST